MNISKKDFKLLLFKCLIAAIYLILAGFCVIAAISFPSIPSGIFTFLSCGALGVLLGNQFRDIWFLIQGYKQ